MLFLYPFVLLSLLVLVGMYGLWVESPPQKVPQLRKEEVNLAPLLAKFVALFPREQEKAQERVPTVQLLATATGSLRLALAQVDGTPRTLRIGTQVQGYSVVEIERNYIVLAKGDNRLAVGFRLAPEPPPQAQAPEQPRATPSVSRSLQASVSKGELERITADPGLMFRQIRLVPFLQEGKTRGFLFEWVEPGSIFDRSGIRPGDVLLSINNQEIRSGEDAFRILQVLRNENSIKLNLQRGNELIELSLRVE